MLNLGRSAGIGLRDSAKLLEKAVELNRKSKIADAQSALFAAQTEQAALVQMIEQLEKEIARLKRWEEEKERYELKRLTLVFSSMRLRLTTPKANHSITNPLERLNKEVKRRADVVGIFPNDASITPLIGAVILEQNDVYGPRVIADRGSRRIVDSAAIRALWPGGLHHRRFR